MVLILNSKYSHVWNRKNLWIQNHGSWYGPWTLRKPTYLFNWLHIRLLVNRADKYLVILSPCLIFSVLLYSLKFRILIFSLLLNQSSSYLSLNLVITLEIFSLNTKLNITGFNLYNVFVYKNKQNLDSHRTLLYLHTYF